jgi:hypothetical protein
MILTSIDFDENKDKDVTTQPVMTSQTYNELRRERRAPENNSFSSQFVVGLVKRIK